MDVITIELSECAKMKINLSSRVMDSNVDHNSEWKKETQVLQGEFRICLCSSFNCICVCDPCVVEFSPIMMSCGPNCSATWSFLIKMVFECHVGRGYYSYMCPLRRSLHLSIELSNPRSMISNRHNVAMTVTTTTAHCRVADFQPEARLWPTECRA